MRGSDSSPPKALRQHQILQRSLYLDSAVQPYTFYVEILATTIRAISGLSRQTPSLRIVKSAGIEHGRLDEVQDGPVDLRPLRFHEVENKFRRPVSTLVHYADGWVVAVGALSHCRAKTASGLRLTDF